MNGQFHYDLAEFLPFHDAEACRRVRAIRREDVTKHPNANFRIRVIEDETAFRFGYVMDIVAGIKRALDEGRKRYVLILPAPNPHYAFVAKMINDLNIPTVNYGPGESHRSHTAHEQLRIDHLLTCVRVYLSTALLMAG